MTHRVPKTVLAEEYPGRALSDIEPINSGNRRQTVRARFVDAPPVVVQWSADSAALRVETALLRAIRSRTTVPVPETLAAGTHEGIGYVLREHCAGDNLHQVFTTLEAATRQRLVATFGRYLGELHAAFEFDGTGPLRVAGTGTGNGERPPLVPTGEPGWQVAYGQNAVARLPAAFDSLRDRLVDCLQSAAPESRPSRLFPWDLRPGNALIEDSQVTAVVDWEGPLAATPALAAAKVRYLTATWYDIETQQLRNAVRNGYESVRPWPDIRAADRVTAIADSAVDSRGRVTNPGYPEYDRERAVAFHREALSRALAE